MFVPNPDIIAATLQAQTTNLATIRGGYVCYDATHYYILDGLTVWAGHGSYLLTALGFAACYQRDARTSRVRHTPRPHIHKPYSNISVSKTFFIYLLFCCLIFGIGIDSNVRHIANTIK